MSNAALRCTVLFGRKEEFSHPCELSSTIFRGVRFCYIVKTSGAIYLSTKLLCDLDIFRVGGGYLKFWFVKYFHMSKIESEGKVARCEIWFDIDLDETHIVTEEFLLSSQCLLKRDTKKKKTMNFSCYFIIVVSSLICAWKLLAKYMFDDIVVVLLLTSLLVWSLSHLRVYKINLKPLIALSQLRLFSFNFILLTLYLS